MSINTEQALLHGDYNTYCSTDEDLELKDSHSFLEEFKQLLMATFPLAITFFLQYAFSITSLIAAGRLGPLALGAASLALTVFNCFGLSIFQGLSTSLDSLCAMTFGRQNFFGVGLYFQRCTAIMFTAMIPLIVFWWYSGVFLGLFVQDRDLVNLAQTFLRWHIVGVPGLILFEGLKRFLQSQHIFHAGTYALAIAVPLNIILNWFLVVSEYGLGYIGIPITIAITYWFMSVLMIGYIYFIDGSKCWGGLQLREAFSNWEPMLSLAIPGVITLISEFLAFEILVFFAANFPDPASKVSAQAIVSNIASLLYQVPFSASVAITTKLSYFIGKKDIYGAKLMIRIFFATAPIMGVINCLIFVLGRSKLAQLFTDDEVVLNLATGLNVLAGINQLCDSFNVLGSGVLRGMFQYKLSSFLSCFCFYGLAIPLGYIMGFKFHHELFGLWYGLIIGVFFLALAQVNFILRSNLKAIIITSHNLHESQ
ncbi:hypothetical protein KGF54_000304 [Candida jiufengensis]|uniref:uncharacterized protein n=1 Tax=Candida jiufengensis TaxID=497108 RepID=UPI002224F62B|nr:uncharacterized protein KGF54_000304 [Candida jiufengensis]KAI5957376.1 hypothetical protein KGF54_000304 [Candida jiufengensis]